MRAYRFANFEFRRERLELYRDRVRVSIRPKTASMLRLLIEQRARIVSKASLRAGVWHSEHVQDQSLFQAISELRKLLAPLDPIKTHPNLGYQWVAPIRELRPGRRARAAAAMAASLVLVVAVAYLSLAGDGPQPNSSQVSAVRLPAMQAFAFGMQHLGEGRAARAAHYFDVAVQENPRFLIARLMAGQALFEQGRHREARRRVEKLLAESGDAQEPYVRVAAMDLLSRISEHSGHPETALVWAQEAARAARRHGFACAAEETAERLGELLAMMPQDATQSTQRAPQHSPLMLAAEAALELPHNCGEPSAHPGASTPDLSQCWQPPEQMLARHRGRRIPARLS